MLGLSCGGFPGWSTSFWHLASGEGFDDDHRATAFGARLALISFVCMGTVIVAGFLISVRLHIKQVPDGRDPFAANAVCQKACVADAVKAGGQNVDQETANELGRGQAHDLHAITMFDAIVFPTEGNRISVRTDQTMI